jgi:hypothetical protein
MRSAGFSSGVAKAGKRSKGTCGWTAAQRRPTRRGYRRTLARDGGSLKRVATKAVSKPTVQQLCTWPAHVRLWMNRMPSSIERGKLAQRDEAIAAAVLYDRSGAIRLA